MRKARGKYTGEKIKARKIKQEKRQEHIQAIRDGKVREELPETMLPEVFKGIEDMYWDRLNQFPTREILKIGSTRLI